MLDNERYGETGMQPTHTAHGVDLSEVARACGFPHALRVTDAPGLEELRSLMRAASGPVFAAVKVVAESPPLALPPRDGVALKRRFREAMDGLGLSEGKARNWVQ